jgi:hypothetical protein
MDLARRKAVLVLGAGISRNSVNAAGARPPLWSEFLKSAMAQTNESKAWRSAVNRLIRDGDYLTACSVIKDRLGPANFTSFMRDQFLTPGFAPAQIHDVLIGLDSRIVLTPNYDKIFETRINAVQNNTVLVKNYYDSDVAQAIRTPGRIVLKVHGTIDTAAEVIITRADYANARQKHRSFYAVLDALAATHTFVFIGCGLNDPDIRLLLEDHAFRSIHTLPHFLLLPKTEVTKHVVGAIESSLGVTLLQFDPKNNYLEFHESLSDLVSQVDSCRAELTPAQW